MEELDGGEYIELNKRMLNNYSKLTLGFVLNELNNQEIDYCKLSDQFVIKVTLKSGMELSFTKDSNEVIEDCNQLHLSCFALMERKAAQPGQAHDLGEDKDLQKLIVDLKSGGMKNLVKQMDNDNMYSDLLIEKLKSEVSSTDFIYFHAYRRSDKLSSGSDKKNLVTLIFSDEYADLKNHIYRCLSSICANTNDKELFGFLIERISLDDDDSITVSILSRLGEVKKAASYNVEPIKMLIAEGRVMLALLD